MNVDRVISLIRSGEYGDPPSLELINSDKRTRKPIKLQELEVLLHKNGIGRKLKSIVEDEQTPSEIKEHIIDFLEFSGSQRQSNLGTNEHDIAIRTMETLDALVSWGLATPEQKQEVISLGGGLVVTELVSQQLFDDALAKIARQDEASEAQSTLESKWNTTSNQYISLWDNYVENDGPKPAEIDKVEIVLKVEEGE